MLRNSVRLFATVLFIAFTGCAKRGTITGGAKDTLAPVLRRSVPENGAVNFNGKEVKLYFNEYIKLKNINKQLIVSPPMKNAPEILPYTASKFITIKLRDTLQPNTTYSFNFGQSIEDNNESNVLPDFRYVFSTGPYIDSLSLKATYRDALNLRNDQFVSVMLYEVNEKYNDSTIYKEPPRYIVNSLEGSGVLQFENLRQGKYRLVAVKDANKNNRYDPKQDKIGFIKDFITLPNDTLYQLELFKETLPFKALKPTQASGNRAILPYEGQPKDLRYEVSRGGKPIPFKVTQFPKKDSLQLWVGPVKNDSIAINVQQYKANNHFVLRMKDMPDDSLTIRAERTGNLPFREKFILNASTPLVNVDNSKIRFAGKDSTAVAFTTKYDEFRQQLQFDFERQPEEQYKITLLPGALTDFYEKSNPRQQYVFSTSATTEYGNLKVVLENVKRFPVIVELTDPEGKVLASHYSEKETVIDFLLVEPSKFNLRLIYDDNRDGAWTPGNYLEKRLSEEVVHFPAAIDVRANWDVEQPFDLSK